MSVSVLYVTDTRHGQKAWHDPSARHRCYHFADALIAVGWRASVAHVDRVTPALVRQFHHVIFHRPKCTDRFQRAISVCRRAGVRLHADYDDLIFKPQLALHSPLFINGNRPLDKVEAYFEANQQALQCFDSVFVSTRELAVHVQEMLPDARVEVLPNSLPRLFQRPRSDEKRHSGFTIGYFPGSNSHAHDVELIYDALDQLFAAEPECRMVVMGRMDAGTLPSGENQVEYKPFVDYNHYLAQLSSVDLSIAPLQRNIFNDAKSAVKLIESVAVGTPILASDNPDMADHSNPMSALVKEAADWFSTLLTCVRQSRFDCAVSVHLQRQFSVESRLPVLQQQLLAAT